jgi:hypothetical protein
MAAYKVIANPDLFKYIQSFRPGFTEKQHAALKVIRRFITKEPLRRAQCRITVNHLSVVATALNFLLVSDDEIVLRYV